MENKWNYQNLSQPNPTKMPFKGIPFLSICLNITGKSRKVFPFEMSASNKNVKGIVRVNTISVQN